MGIYIGQFALFGAIFHDSLPARLRQRQRGALVHGRRLRFLQQSLLSHKNDKLFGKFVYNSDYNNLRAFIPRASAEEIVQFRIRNLDPSARNPPLMFNRSVLPFNDLFKAVPRNLWAAAIASGYVDRNRLDAIAGVDAIGGYIPDGEVII